MNFIEVLASMQSKQLVKYFRMTKEAWSVFKSIKLTFLKQFYLLLLLLKDIAEGALLCVYIKATKQEKEKLFFFCFSNKRAP